MKKKTMMIALCALILVCVGAYAATKITVTDKPQMENLVESTGHTETAETTEITEQTGTAEAEAEIVELGGRITEIADGYIVMETLMHGMVQVNLGDDTLYDGADPDELAVGQYIQVMYDGKMTRSLPAQITALKVGLYPVSGVVKELGENSVTLSREEIGDEVIVFLPEGAEALSVGDSVTAYTNGAMTMSLPAQTNAIGVVKH